MEKCNPCQGSCPLQIDIPGFIAQVEAGCFAEAYQNITEKARPAHPAFSPKSDRPKVAIVGTDPAGLSCAAELVKRGYAVTILEADQALQIDTLLNSLRFEAVFMASAKPSSGNIPGENLKGVYKAQAKNLAPVQRLLGQGKRQVMVVGSDAAALQTARDLKSMGAQVTLITEYAEQDVPAGRKATRMAKKEGIEFLCLTRVKAVNGDQDGWVSSLRCQEMFVCPTDESGKAKTLPLYDSDFIVEADCVLIADSPSPQRSGLPAVSKKPHPGVFISPSTSSVQGAAAGKSAAAEIDAYIQNKIQNKKEMRRTS